MKLEITTQNATAAFKNTNKLEFSYTIGQHNGVLTVTVKKQLSTAIHSVEEVIIVREFSPTEWKKVMWNTND